MSTEGFLSKEDFIKQHGYDPDTGFTPEGKLPVQKPSIGRVIADVGVGAATAIPTFIPSIVGLGNVALQAGKAAYSTSGTDQKFMDAFSKNVMTDDAPDLLKEHLAYVVNKWKKTDPTITDAEIPGLLQQYQHSKPFEEFSRELQITGVGATNKIMDTARGLVGDKRTDEQRSWIDDVAEVAGSALVGAPAGIANKIGMAAARNAVTNAAINNPVSRAALKAAEVLSPVTMPYTPGNIALNFGVGAGINQAISYAAGKDNVFSNPTEASIPQLGIVATAVGGAAVFAAALKGHGLRSIQGGQLEQAFSATPGITSRMTNAPEGVATIIGGKPISEFGEITPAYNPTLPWYQAVQRRLGTAFNTEEYMARKMINEVNGRQTADEFVNDFATNTGAALRDTAHANTSGVMDDWLRFRSTLDDATRSQIETGWQLSTMKGHRNRMEQQAQDEVNDLAAQAAAGTLRHDGLQRLQELQDSLTRLRADDPSARKYLPDIPDTQKAAIANAFETDMHPVMVEARRIIRELNETVLGQLHNEGAITRQEMQDLLRSNPYFAPLRQDPYEGRTGLSRVWNMLTRGVKEDTLWSGQAGPLNKSPIRGLDLEIPNPKVGDDQVVITRPLDPTTMMQHYVFQAQLEMGHIRMRREGLQKLSYDQQGNPTEFLRDGYIKLEADRHGRTAFSSAEMRMPLHPANAWMNSEHHVPSWDNGYVSFYRLGDPELVRMFRQDPYALGGFMQAAAYMATLFKMNTTGIFAPLFAIKNMFMDAGFGQATIAPNRAFGPLQYQLRKYLPDWFNRQVLGRIPDPTMYLSLPFQAGIAAMEMVRFHTTHSLARDLAMTGPFQALARSLGVRNWDNVIRNQLAAVDKLTTVMMMKRGIAHNSAIEGIEQARGAVEMMKGLAPEGLKKTYNAYSDIVSAIHLAPKRMFFTENYALAERHYGVGRVPQREVDNLVAEARALAGNMTARPGSQTLRNMEKIMPYQAPIRNSMFHLVRNMSEAGKAEYVIPRVMLMVGALGSAHYMMTYWDDKSREYFWKQMPDWERWRTVIIPNMETSIAWFSGKEVPFSLDKVYKVTIAPDITPLVAGGMAFAQQIGLIPADATVKPIYKDMPKIMLDSLTPAMPPALQAFFAWQGVKLDPQGADTRGGSWIRGSGGLQSGPQAEAATNLGQVTNSTALMMNAVLGVNGSHMAAALDAFLYASGHKQTLGDNGQTEAVKVADRQYMDGLRAATGVVKDRMTRAVPDIPLLWQGEEKRYLTNPVSESVAISKNNIKEISGMRNYAVGPAAVKERALIKEAGGIAKDPLTEQTLVAVSQDVFKWANSKTSDFYRLKDEYTSLGKQRRSLEIQFNLPSKDRVQKINAIAEKQQQNMEQQRLAIQFKEEEIAQNYGSALGPIMQGRAVNMSNLNEVMRKSISSPSQAAPEE